MLEANPRASRTVPFASKATGLNLVEAACRLAAGARSCASSACRPSGRRSRSSVKAAVLPFARFPGSDPVLGPGDALDRRGDGLAPPTCRPRSRRPSAPPAGRCRPPARRSSPCATPTRRRCGRWRRRSPGSASSSSRPRERRVSCATAGLEVEQVAKVAEGGEATVVDLIRRGTLRPRRQHAVRRLAAAHRRLPDPRGGARRARSPASRRSPAPRPPCTRSRTRARSSRCRSRSASMSRRDRSGHDASVAARRSGRTRCSGSSAAGSSPGIPGQFFMLEAPGRLLPRPMSLCLAPPGELAFLIDPIGPGTQALVARSSRRRDPRLRPARQRLPARRRAAAARRRRDRDRAAAVPVAALGRAAGRARLPLGVARRGGRARPERRGRRSTRRSSPS